MGVKNESGPADLSRGWGPVPMALWRLDPVST